MNAPLPIARALDAYIAEHAAQRFSWSRHNCCHFAAGWVLAATGIDPMAGLPWTHDRLSAYRLIRRLGGSLSGAWSRRLGRGPIQPELAQLGDIVLVHVEPEDVAAVGICTGSHVSMLTEGEGVVMLPMAHASQAWRLHGEPA